VFWIAFILAVFDTLLQVSNSVSEDLILAQVVDSDGRGPVLCVPLFLVSLPFPFPRCWLPARLRSRGRSPIFGPLWLHI